MWLPPHAQAEHTLSDNRRHLPPLFKRASTRCSHKKVTCGESESRQADDSSASPSVYHSVTVSLCDTHTHIHCIGESRRRGWGCPGATGTCQDHWTSSSSPATTAKGDGGAAGGVWHEQSRTHGERRREARDRRGETYFMRNVSLKKQPCFQEKKNSNIHSCKPQDTLSVKVSALYSRNTQCPVVKVVKWMLMSG